MKLYLCTLIVIAISAISFIQGQPPTYEEDPFRQIHELLPSPNESRLASGAPGPKYWQQRVDYNIQVQLDDEKQRLVGSEKINYRNNSPHELKYLWVQLDQNRFAPGSDESLTKEAPGLDNMSFQRLRSQLYRETFQGGHKIKSVSNQKGKPIKHEIVGTMMRIDLDDPMTSGSNFIFQIDWEYNIIDADLNRARSGYEFFKKDKNYIYELAQWFPRMAAYTDYTGWQNKQFLGSGEFALEFGNYTVEITTPADHIVAATGELQNPKNVMTTEQINRWNKAKSSGAITFIVNPEEAEKNQTKDEKVNNKKTWVFKAKNVRDFAWASSRKFIWDAKYHEFSKGKKAWAMSYYPIEAEPLWSKYSTESVAHTLDVYSKFTFDYPYPVAISVNGPVFGMEYPMICFNGPRPEEDGTYSESTKNALIGVVIHEVGHNWFPMIVNSDERQWTWMDEGLNTFLQFLAQAEWQQKWSSGRGKPKSITSYMASSKQRPIMTNSESIHQFGNNAYSKPAAALNVLRETVMGRKLFDFAFKEYSTRWMFKRPEPADFFRTMEDASSKDLDWFWRGWFYTTKNVDIGVKSLRLFEIDTKDPDIEKPLKKQKREDLDAKDLIDERNGSISKATDRNRNLLDFYNKYDPLDITKSDRREYNEWLKDLEPEELKLLSLRKKFYVVELENIGGLVSPVILEISFKDGKNKRVRIPAEIWKRNNGSVNKLIISQKEITQIEVDPMLETADTDRQNNFWPRKAIESRFQLQKRKRDKNPMQKARAEEERSKKEKQTKVDKSNE
ncbi:MAG: M1 family peptidase [Verrucomicrobia bacterium]|nr:M1 family metallopeptidase [Verrucomicrobiota bacterium]RCL31327.1 MAG: M1 family peptidase [Verrucomicrobiota bacterium]